MTTNVRHSSQTKRERHVELWLMVAVLLIAAFFRFYRPTGVPPGPSHDELRMMQLGGLIVDGERPLHWKISYSAEPLYMYLLALAMPTWGFTPFGARLVTRFAGLLLIPVSHRLIKRLFGWRVALFTSGVLSVTWWPLFFSRVALRGITLSLTFTGAVFCLWLGLDVGNGSPNEAVRRTRWRWLVAGAGLMGLTWYTFTGARSTILLLPILLVYLGLLGLIPFRQLWPAAVVALGMAALVAAPFIYEVRVHPGTAETRLGQLGGIIDALLAGNPLPAIKQSANTLGLFLFTGDPNWRYNVSGRPPFGPILGALGVLGLLTCVARWKEPRHFILVAWTLLGLAPAMLTPEAPSFVRAIGALPAVAVFPGVGAVALTNWAISRMRGRFRRIVPLLLVLPLALNGFDTFRDYFVTWSIQPEVHEIYQTGLTEAFRDLNKSNLEGTIWASEPFPDDRHLLLADRILRREEIELRWFNAERGLILPPVEGARRYLLADFVEPDATLFTRWMNDATTILEGIPPPGAPSYRVYQVQGENVETQLSEIAAQSKASLDLRGQRHVPLPARFEDTAMLLGYELEDDRLNSGEDVDLIVYWCVQGPVYEPLASFAHLIDTQSNVLGQYDGFDVPPWYWQSGTVIAQVYQFPIDPKAEPGPHWLEVGLYHSDTMQRLDVVDETGVPLGDRLVLKKVILE